MKALLEAITEGLRKWMTFVQEVEVDGVTTSVHYVSPIQVWVGRVLAVTVVGMAFTLQFLNLDPNVVAAIDDLMRVAARL